MANDVFILYSNGYILFNHRKIIEFKDILYIVTEPTPIIIIVIYSFLTTTSIMVSFIKTNHATVFLL